MRTAKTKYSNINVVIEAKSTWVAMNIRESVPGASVRNSARGQGHEEGGSAYVKVGSSLRSPPGNA